MPEMQSGAELGSWLDGATGSVLMGYLKRRRDLKVCQSKRSYPSADSAWAAARRLRKDLGVNARAYFCKGAKGQKGHYHVTSGSW